MMSYDFKNWAKIVEEKDAYIERLNEAFKNVIERLENESYYTQSTFDEYGWSNDDSEKVVDLYAAIDIVEDEVKNARSK